MRRVNIKDLKFDEFTKINPSFGGSTSNIYTDGKLVYKLYNDTIMSDVKLLKSYERVINLLGQIRDLDVALLPRDIIVEKSFLRYILRGITMDCLEGVTLYDLYEQGREEEVFRGVLNASRGLKTIHDRPENIVIGDTNFSNVMMLTDKNGENTLPRFIDFDSVSIGNNIYEYVINSKVIKFLVNTGKDINVNSNLDRLSYLLEFLNIVFGIDSVHLLNLNELDRLSAHIDGFKDLKRVICNLLDTNNCMPYIPYLHEVFSEKDSDAFVKRYEIIY